MADKKENVQLEKTMDKAEQEKLESVKKADAAVKTMQEISPFYGYFHDTESLRSGQGSPQRSEAKIRRAVYHTSSLCGNHTCRS